MMLKSFILFSIAVLAGPNPSQASENLRDCSESFAQAGRAIPNALQTLSYPLEISGVSLAHVQKVIEITPVIAARRQEIRKWNKGERTTARWETAGSSTKILVACEEWSRMKISEQVLALHEYLGIAGYNDADYRLSITLWILANPIGHRVLRENEKALLQGAMASFSKTTLALGGVISVGGGGETLTVAARLMEIESALKKIKASDSELLRQEKLRDLGAYLFSYLNVYPE